MARPSKTSSELTIAHYSRPEVKEVITKFCDENGKSWRALNGDEGWYITTENNQVRLRNPEDYNNTIHRFRTLYATLDIFENKVKDIKKTWGENKPSEVLGTFKDCYGYTLGADIDSIEHDLTNPENRLAVEQMARYLVQRLFDAEIRTSVYCLQSGGGIYVLLHHSLCCIPSYFSSDEHQREEFFRTTTASFKMWLADVEKDFFKLHPALKNKVKIDKLTNQKRKFKVIFSIHKKHDLAVIPLDPSNISINLEKAKLPISDEVIAEGKDWYNEDDPEERFALLDLLAPYEKEVKEDFQDRVSRGGDYTISKSTNILPEESWPPCMKNIVSQVSPSKGPHRALAVLAAYLYQIGWPEDTAFNFWYSVANNVDVEPRIFDVWYGQMCCPRCSKIKNLSSGYPEVGLGGLDYCKPDSKCGVWPGDYSLEQTDFGGTKGIEWAKGYFIDPFGKTKLGYREKNTNEQIAKWVSDGWVCINYILESIDSKGSIERSYVFLGKPHLKKEPLQPCQFCCKFALAPYPDLTHSSKV